MGRSEGFLYSRGPVLAHGDPGGRAVVGGIRWGTRWSRASRMTGRNTDATNTVLSRKRTTLLS